MHVTDICDIYIYKIYIYNTDMLFLFVIYVFIIYNQHVGVMVRASVSEHWQVKHRVCVYTLP